MKPSNQKKKAPFYVAVAFVVEGAKREPDPQPLTLLHVGRSCSTVTIVCSASLQSPTLTVLKVSLPLSYWKN